MARLRAPTDRAIVPTRAVTPSVVRFLEVYQRDGTEVDFLLGSQAAIEVKATATATRADTRGLAEIAGEANFERRILSVRRIVDRIEILPVHTFLDDLWSGEVREPPWARP